LERELAFSLWAYTTHEEDALKYITSNTAGATHSYLQGYYFFMQGSQEREAAKQTKDYILARQALERAIHSQQFVAPSNYILAVIAQRENEPERATKLLEAGMAYDPEYSSFYISRAIVHAIQHEINPALDDIENAVKLSVVHCHTVLRSGSDPSHPLSALRDEARFIALTKYCETIEEGFFNWTRAIGAAGS
jgi:Tfp pilus assembly protein PilF